ncbi:MAG: hypothetical protein IPO81_07835 [Kouleothrix sp.]|nr:hypothetical protein [Kouleothrix sp.]
MKASTCCSRWPAPSRGFASSIRCLADLEEDKETRRQGDKETRRQGDKETRRQGDKESFN